MEEDRQGQHQEKRGAVWQIAGVALGVLLGFLIGFGYGAELEWIGVAKDPAYKTVWDWLELLFVPAAIAVSIFLLDLAQRKRESKAQVAQRKRELAVEERRAQDEALQAYLDKMSELLIDGNLHEKADQYDTTRITARARTLAVLRRLDGKRKKTVLLFLREARLINRYDFLDPEKWDDVRYYAHYVGLEDADLSKAELDRARLISTSGIEPISLKGANLRGADLSYADLSGANLSDADLIGTDLSKADLSAADLSAADLSYADLEGAEGITMEELERQAKSLEGAIMPNGQKYED
jgi:hypothetical protein